jgi:putative ABC transport system substrate-binding protein
LAKPDVEGQNVTVEYHWLEGQYDRLPALMADLVRRHVAVIAIPGTAGASTAAKAATATIPIVFGVGDDPVKLGLVANLARPGTNLAGSANLTVELAPKQLQLLHELIPNAALFGVLRDPPFFPAAAQSVIADLQAAARTLGAQLVVVNARTDSDLETAFAAFLQQRVDAVLVSPSAFFAQRIEQLAPLAAHRALPAISHFREFALAGGLMSYGSSQVGVYTGRILKGEKPADLLSPSAHPIRPPLSPRLSRAS